jgi:exodeoxyribonuclease V beta subunit
MSDIQPLDPLRVPLNGIQLIEASAGTGKTWTLAALYVRLVLGHGGQPPQLPAQILVVTFTRAATAELRERIRERLATAAAAFRGQAEPDEYLRALIAEYSNDDQRAAAARQLDLAAQWMDEAAIYTIHGWCQRMLTQHAFEGTDAVDVIADENARLTEAVHDYWRCFYANLGEADAAIVATEWATPDQLQQALRAVIRQPANRLRINGQPLPLVADLSASLAQREATRRAAERTARAIWMQDASAIEALIRTAVQSGALNKNSYRPANLDRDMFALHAWANGDDAQIDALKRYTQAKLDKARNKNGAPTTHAVFNSFQTVADALENEAPLAPLLLTHAVPWIDRRLDQIRERQATLGYDDMLRLLDMALASPHGASLAQTIAEQYPIALIDEFQDTDPLQWRIFQRIYVGRKDTGLLLIGDPKQSIYAFRGADINTYLTARDDAQSPRWTLLSNYRSTPALVGAVNQLFTHADQHDEGAFGFGRGEHGLPFQPVEAKTSKGSLRWDNTTIPAMSVIVLSDVETINVGGYLEQSARHAAGNVTGLLTEAQDGGCTLPDDNGSTRPLRPRDIAILVRDYREATCMRHALRLCNVASVYMSERDSVYDTREANDVLLWLQACANAGSDRAMRAALATLTMHRSLFELDLLNHDESTWEQCDEQLHALQRIWQRHGVLAMLHNWMHAFDLPARLLAKPNGERALTNLQHLAELLQHAAAGLDGEHALVRYLAAQIAYAAEPNGQIIDDQILRLESEADLVRIVTIHKSKGLQYPVVMLPFICRPRKESAEKIQPWHDDTGHSWIDLQPDEEALARIERERLQEDLRLLYVALTRAEYACFIEAACVTIGNAKASSLHRTAFGYLLGGGQPIEPGDLVPCLQAMRGENKDIHIDVANGPHSINTFYPAHRPSMQRSARISSLQPPEPWWIASYSALTHGASDIVRTVAPETASQDVLTEAARETFDLPIVEHDRNIHAFPRGAEPGTFLHDLLEWIAESGFANVAADTAALEKHIARRCQRRGWQMWIVPLTQWLSALLQTPLALPDRGTLTLAELANHSHYQAELEFWFEANHVDTQQLDHLVTQYTLSAAPRPTLAHNRVNGMLKGFIDLIAEKDGRYYIIDYKSNWLGDNARAYTVEAMRDAALQSRYDLQYAIYTLALHRHLRARIPGYQYERHIGGVMYLYLRGVDGAGHGIHTERLPFALIDAMDCLFAQGVSADVA